MQKTKLNKILIFLVVVIWGILLFNFFSAYFTESKIEKVKKPLVANVPLRNQIKKDTFVIHYPKRDPFLGKSSTVKVAKQYISKKKKIVSANKTLLTWPKIIYLGFVKSNSNKLRLGLLRINGILYRVHKGTTESGVKIIDINKEYIRVQFDKETKDINRS